MSDPMIHEMFITIGIVAAIAAAAFVLAVFFKAVSGAYSNGK